MANDHIPRPDTQFHAWQNNFVTHVNSHLADLALATGAMVAEIWSRVAWASRPRICDPPPTGPLPIGRPRKRKVVKKRGQKQVAVAIYSFIMEIEKQR